MDNIHNKKEYYFITKDAINNNCITMSQTTEFKILDELIISQFSPNESCLVIPRNFFKSLNPQEDFDIKIKVNNRNEVMMPPGDHFVSLGKIINEAKYKDNDRLTHTLLTSGLPSIDLGDSLLVIPTGMLLTKFTDSKVRDKLCKALLFSLFENPEPSIFKLSNGCGIDVICTICFSQKLISRKGKEVGKYIASPH